MVYVDFWLWFEMIVMFLKKLIRYCGLLKFVGIDFVDLSKVSFLRIYKNVVFDILKVSYVYKEIYKN